MAFAGPDWVSRLDALLRNNPTLVLANSPELPAWLCQKPGYNIWKRNNLWQLHAALTNGGLHMTLLALWDGKTGDGTGGTEHMVAEAKERGARVMILHMQDLIAS